MDFVLPALIDRDGDSAVLFRGENDL